MGLQELKDLLKEKGVVGAGGAGFPTYAKLSYSVNTVILNGAECEPLFRVDQNLLAIRTYEILKGLDNIVEAVGAKEGIVAFKEHYHRANEAVDEILCEFPRLRKVLLKDGYPAGDEVVLVYETTGRVVPQGGIPINVGAMVTNVETALNIYNAMEKNEAVTYKYVTVGGAVNEPKTLKVPIGTSFSELIEEVNGPSIKDYKLLVGGPMTGRVGSLNESVTKTTKGIFILPSDNPVIELREYKVNIALKRTMSICSQCRMCTDLCPRNLLGHSIEPHKIMNSLAFGLDYDSAVFVNALACCECNLCSAYSCHQNLNPKAIISDLKKRLRANGVKLPSVKVESLNGHSVGQGKGQAKGNINGQNEGEGTGQVKGQNSLSQGQGVMGGHVKEERDYRRVPVSRVIGRLKLTEYNVDTPLVDMHNKSALLNISTRQSIGAPSKPVVNKGDKVIAGQVIGEVLEKDLGVYLHSPINGVIEDANDLMIIIRREE